MFVVWACAGSWGLRPPASPVRAFATTNAHRRRTHASAPPSAVHCGNDDPLYHDVVNVQPITVEQVYHEEGERVLQTVVDQNIGGDPPSSLPNLASTARPIRILAVWDVIETGDQGVCENGSGSCTYQCSYSSSTGVSVKSASNTYTTSGFSCADKNAASGTNLEVMKGRTAEAVAYWQKTIKVTPVLDGIAVNNNVAKSVHLPLDSNGAWEKGLQASVDLLLIMTARPSPFSPIAGYAMCIQADQFGRCTVGQFNWVPEVLSISGWVNKLDAAKESELHTALHEIMHVLGGMGPGVSLSSSSFITPAGVRAPTANIITTEDDPAYPGANKPITYISTPRVLNFTRTYFNCPIAKGFPLEDVPLGKGAHWEARVAGPELMSYGSNSGQVYISDLTLGYLEDTGHYIVNYSMAGPIVAPTFDEAVSLGTTETFLDETGAPFVAPAPLPAGIPRWGYQGGCDFLGYNGLPRNTMKHPYICSQNNAYMCTADNRMSAVCVIQNTWNTLPEKNSWGRYVQQQGSGSEYGAQPFTTGSPGNNNELPPFFQFFPTDAAAAAASKVDTATASKTGGYNDAMDYLPVPVGYWNCMFPQQSSNSTASGTGFSLSSVSSFFGRSSDMAQFGGQARCPTCRCLNSSLIEMSSGNLNPMFPRYGLCYRTNCARLDYLQVGIRGQLDSRAYWYRCPTAGGKLYIPGFFGALTCPDAASFCRYETITAFRYVEQNVFTEAIFWGSICAGFFLAFLMFACPCLRDRTVNCAKRACGARVFDPPGGHPEHGEHGEHEPQKLPAVPARILFVVTMITLLGGLALIALMSYIIKTTNVFTGAIDILAVGVLLAMLSLAGCQSSRKVALHGPSCWLLAFFFMNLAVVLLILFVVSWNLAGYANWKVAADNYYEFMVATKYFVPVNATRAVNVALATSTIQKQVSGLMGVGVGVELLLVVAAVAAAVLLSLRTLVAITYTFVNNILAAFGLLVTAVVAYLFFTNGKTVAGMMDLVGYVLGMGILFFVSGVVGHCAVRRKSFPLNMGFMFLAVCIMGVCAGAAWMCFNKVDAALAWLNRVSQQDNVDLSALTTSMGLNVDIASLSTTLAANLRKLGLAFACMFVVQVPAVVSAGLFVWAIKSWKVEHGVRLTLPP
jgi:hypothetical protein